MAKGLLLINLGSPVAPTKEAVSVYLKEFLTDPYVIDSPWPVRQVLVHGLIAPFRSSKTAEAYQKIWRQEGSPLVHFTKSFTEKVAAQLGNKYEVRWAMRYGQPSIASVVADWRLDELYVVPLYPQFAESSTQTAIDELEKALKQSKAVAKTSVLVDFYNEPEFIESEVKTIAAARQEFPNYHLLLSFHSLPQHHVNKLYPTHCHQLESCCDKIDARNRFCYRAQSLSTAREIARGLGLNETQYTVSFQSRLGRRPWLKPYTDEIVERLVRRGVKHLLVSCPSFVADCLETLEEIEMRLREQFLSLGGEGLRLVPALNDSEIWVQQFSKMIQKPQLPWQTV